MFFLANTDEKIIDYDPNDPNLVDEPYLDVDNPYEGLGPGRPDSFARTLLPTAGRQSPDSIGQGKSHCLRTSLLCISVLPIVVCIFRDVYDFSPSWLW